MIFAHTILDAVAGGVIVLDRTPSEASIAYLNPAACRMLGVRREDGEGQGFGAWAARIGLVGPIADLAQAIRCGQAGTWCISLPANHASFARLELTLQPEAGQDNCRYLVLSVRECESSTDPAEHKRNEEALRASEARLADLMHHLDGIIWEADPLTFHFQFVSSGAERILGYPVRCWLDDPNFWVSHIHPDDRERVVLFCRSSTAQGVNHDFEYRMLAADGRVVWLHDRVSVQTRDGTPIRLRGMMLDITRRMVAEAEAAFSHAILEKAGDAILVIAVESAQQPPAPSRIASVNEAFLQQMGYTREEMLGRSPFELLGPRTDRPTVLAMEQALRRGESVRVELFTHRKDGSDFPVELDLKPVAIQSNRLTHVVVIQRDVTQRHQLEARLRETQKLESLGLLAGGVAHDFNNLLTTILGYASLAQRELPGHSPVLGYMNQIQTSSQRAADLCQQLLAYAGRGRVVVGPFNLSELVEESVGLLRLSLSRKANLTMHLDRTVPNIRGDANQIRQVVMNLLMNASEALEDRPGTITLVTRVETLTRGMLTGWRFGEERADGTYVLLEVCDTGCGMDEATRGRIFDPFFTTKPMGRGLGMAAVLGIVKTHHGAIQIQSEVGQGSTLRLIFPPCEIPTEPSPKPPTGPLLNTGRILIIDDEPGVRGLARRMLASLGFECLEAADGLEGLEAVRTQAAALSAILLDMTMPRLTGSEAYPRIRALAPDLPVLVMSGYSAAEVTTNFADRRHLGFLQKPFTVSELMNGLSALLPTLRDQRGIGSPR